MPPPVKRPVGQKSMGQFLKEKGVDAPGSKRTTPLWKGPCDSSKLGGITFSMLSRFLVCRERFRLYALEGLQTREGWNHRTGYGDMWHCCEAAYAVSHDWDAILDALRDHARRQCKAYPTQQEEIGKWYHICKVQFPEYKKYWANYKETRKITNIEAEKPFCIPYKLPSGRTVYMRGKRDSVDHIQELVRKNWEVWLQENKSKSEINQMGLIRQLKFDLQTMMYLTALYNDPEFSEWQRSMIKQKKGFQIAGVRYNVIRRPLSGGKGSIRQHKPSKANPAGETETEFYERLRSEYIAKEPETYFVRFEVPVSKQDVQVFEHTCLQPILEQLCDWYEHMVLTRCFGPNANPFGPTSRLDIKPSGKLIHWRHPFGVWNVLDEGGSSDLDEYLASGSEIGLVRVNKLFPELN